MNKIGWIYKITCLVNLKNYVGKHEGKNINKRWNDHKRELRRNTHDNDYLQNAWNKYGEENFIFEVIEKFDTEMNFDLKSLEKYWIKELDSKNRDKGYNLTDGGDGTCGYKHSEESRQKHKESMQKHYDGAEFAKKISDGQKKRYEDPEAYKRHCDGQKKRFENPEEVKRLSDMNKGKHRSISTEFKSRRVICINNNKEYESVSSAARDLNIGHSHISCVCLGKRNHVGGYKFQYI